MRMRLGRSEVPNQSLCEDAAPSSHIDGRLADGKKLSALSRTRQAALQAMQGKAVAAPRADKTCNLCRGGGSKTPRYAERKPITSRSRIGTNAQVKNEMVRAARFGKVGEWRHTGEARCGMRSVVRTPSGKKWVTCTAHKGHRGPCVQPVGVRKRGTWLSVAGCALSVLRIPEPASAA